MLIPWDKDHRDISTIKLFYNNVKSASDMYDIIEFSEKDGKVYASCFNGDIFMSSTVNMKTPFSSFTLQASEIVKIIAQNFSRVETEDKTTGIERLLFLGDKVKIGINKLTTKIPFSIPADGIKTKFKISGRTLHNIKDKCLPFCSDDIARYSLDNINIRTKDGEMQIAATDAKKIAWYREKVEFVLEKELLINKRFIKFSASIFPIDSQIEVSIFENGLIFSNDLATIYTRMADGKFPPYDRILPKEEYPNVWTFRVEDLVEMVKTITLADSATKSMDLTFKKDKLLAKSTGETKDIESEEKLENKLFSNDVTVCFNYEFMSACLAALEEEPLQASPTIKVKSESDMVIIIQDGSDFKYMQCALPIKKT